MKNSQKSICPCTILDEPCHPQCSCKNPFMSGGCYCCSTYGNDEQRKAAAKWIMDAVKEKIKRDSK